MRIKWVNTGKGIEQRLALIKLQFLLGIILVTTMLHLLDLLRLPKKTKQKNSQKTKKHKPLEFTLVWRKNFIYS